MGDRANIVVEEWVPKGSRRKAGRVYLYGHWIGPRTIEVAQTVIERGERLGDSSYLARIILETMIPADQKGDSLSYGISTTITDNEYPLIVFSPYKGQIWLETYNLAKLTKPVPFEKFAEAAGLSGRDFDELLKHLPKA